ncbi:MAG: YggS family pyridoxal phosphate-dependent enzyme [Candidatus Omnitrophota bacterium]|nr:YggS family pyridoxal phosphate-dependent enzyme [Candidatus Omnitrophota bacterium]
MIDERIGRNIDRIMQVISALRAATGENQREITIVAVTKGRTVEQIKEVIAQGIAGIGENRVQEALVKYNALPHPRYAPRLNPALSSLNESSDDRKGWVKWHMIGHLQTNKVKEAVRIFDLIQSVDSPRLAQAISKEAGKINKQQDILLEVQTSPEKSKFGLKPQEIPEVFKEISSLPHLEVKGLMTIAPFTDNPETSRPYFKMLRELSEKIDWRQWTTHRGPILSMGMSGDFAVAIEEGANMIRLGRAIFSRP